MLRAAMVGLFVLVALSGCLSTADRGLALSEYAECRLTGPEGEPLDCSILEPLALQPNVPNGWVCVGGSTHTYDDGRTHWSLWTDEEGHFGFWADHDSPSYPDMVFLHHVRLNDGAWAVLGPTHQGFGLIPGNHPASGDMAVMVHNFWDFHASGALDRSRASWTPVSQDVGYEIPWSHLQVEQNGDVYAFPMMTRSPLNPNDWITVDVGVSGLDFAASLAHGLLVGGSGAYSVPTGISLPALEPDTTCGTA